MHSVRAGRDGVPKIRQVQLRHTDECSTRTPSNLALVLHLVGRPGAAIDAQLGTFKRGKLGLQDAQGVAEM